MNIRSLLQLIVAVVIVSLCTSAAVVFSAPPGSPYTLGETLAPTCAPNTANCTVVPPAASGINADITSLQDLDFVGIGASVPTDTEEFLISAPNMPPDDRELLASIQGSMTGSSGVFSGIVGLDVVISSDVTGAGGTEAYAYYGGVSSANDADEQLVYASTLEMETHNLDSGYGLYVWSPNGPTSGGTQYGIYIDLLDADATRYGIYQNGADTTNYFAGNVGIGTTSTGSSLDILTTNSSPDVGVFAANIQYNDTGVAGLGSSREPVAIKAKVNASGNYSSDAYTFPTGGTFLADYSGTISGTAGSSVVGLYGDAMFSGTTTSTGYVESVGGYFYARGNIGTSGDTHHIGVQIGIVSGTADENCGLCIQEVSGATTNYAINYAGGPFVVMANGRVGIGTDNPGAALNIQGTGTTFSQGIMVQDTFADLTDKGAMAIVGARHNNAHKPFAAFGTYDWSGGSEREVFIGGGGWGMPGANVIVFRTAALYNEIDDQDLERMRITANGNVGIGTDNPNDALVEVKGGTVCVDTNSDNNATSCITAESDIRLKKNIKPIEGALDKIMQLRGVEFDWRWDEYGQISRYESKSHDIGVIAQEVEAVFPEALGEDINGYKTVDYRLLVAPLIESVKELKTENDALKQLVCLDHPEAEYCNE